MSAYIVAADSFVVTQTGPAILGDVVAKDDRVLIVHRDGQLGFSELTQLDEARSDHPSHRIFTKMGDLSLPDGSDILVRGTPLSGAEIQSKVQSESAVRVEIVNVHHVKRNVHRVDKAQAYKRCLADVGRAIHVPRLAAETNGIEREIEAVLDRAGVDFNRLEDDRWVVYDFDPPTRPPGREVSQHHAEAFMVLTAWPAKEGSLVSRTRTEETMLRRALIASLVAQGSPFETTWVPGYHPVECRLQRVAREERRAFRSVTAAAEERITAFELATADPGSLVVNLMLVPEAS